MSPFSNLIYRATMEALLHAFCFTFLKDKDREMRSLDQKLHRFYIYVLCVYTHIIYISLNYTNTYITHTYKCIQTSQTSTTDVTILPTEMCQFLFLLSKTLRSDRSPNPGRLKKCKSLTFCKHFQHRRWENFHLVCISLITLRLKLNVVSRLYIP